MVAYLKVAAVCSDVRVSGSGCVVSCVCIMRGAGLLCFYLGWSCRAWCKPRIRCFCQLSAWFLSFLVSPGWAAVVLLIGLTCRSKGRAASWRFWRFIFYQALWLRLTSVSGTPLSSTLGFLGWRGWFRFAFVSFGVAGSFLVCFGLPLQTPTWVCFFWHRHVGWGYTVGCVYVMRGVALGLRPSLVSAHDASREPSACLAYCA